MARLSMSLALALLFACSVAVAVSASADSAPVPEGFSLPNIFNPVLDRADGRDQAKTLVQLVAKEPKVAFGVGGPEAALEDLWNGEADPESSASLAQLKMLKEVDQLSKLIDQGKKILKVLPRKEARLALLKKKLSTILDAKAKREAGEKLDEQQALLNAIKKREGKMSSRLSALKTSQAKLTASVGKLQKVIAGPSDAAPAAASGEIQVGRSPAKSSRSAKAGKRSFLEVATEQTADAELDQELQFEAAEAYDQEE